MKHPRTVFSLLLALLTACGGGATSGMPAGDHVHSLGVTADGGLLLGLHGGLYQSDDGQSWDLVGMSGEDAMVIAATAGEESVFVAGHEVLYRSADGGESFSPLDPTDLPGLDIHGFAQAPTDAETVYALVVGHGLYASDDAGDTWELRADLVPRDGIGLAAVGTVEQTLILVGPESGVLLSADGGLSFAVVSEVPTWAVTVEKTAPDTVWSLGSAGLARSSDTGHAWEIVSPLDDVEGQPVALAAHDDELWLVAEQPRALYRSDDNGVTWIRIAGT